MIFYDCKMSYKLGARSALKKEMKEKSKRDWGDDVLQDINEHLNENANEEKLSLIIYRIGRDYVYMLITSLILQQISPSQIQNHAEKLLVKQGQFSEIQLETLKEVVPLQAKKICDIAEASDYIGFRSRLERIFNLEYPDFTLDYYNCRQFKVKEYLLSEKSLSLPQARSMARKMMLHESFMEELERIYDEQNPREFFGHPVHYKVTANSSTAAAEVAKLLCQALCANGRLVSRCLKHIYDVTEDCYREDDMDNLFHQSDGGTILIELRGSNEYHQNYASCYEEVVKNLVSLVKKYQMNTLFIFVEITDHPGFATNLISELQEDLFMVELKEGIGNRAAALRYLKGLAKENNSFSYTEDELSSALGDKTSFRPSDVHNIYENLYRSSLRNKTYASYRQASCLTMSKLTVVDKDSYQALQDMIGLKDVKNMVRQILSSAKMKKYRSDFGLKQESPSLHMVFTGNPGSAKTTVARLLAEILSHEGVLKSGQLVECGRNDLVGQYVGWTAPTVAKLFRRAKGGILFIDEAYSLVDDRDGLFGDEAINTIVQEMENNRDDTIVIFAGYPDKMKKFLAKNEGLKSRISFHLDFPDYNEDELLAILSLMASKKGYQLSQEVQEKCRHIFAAACQQEDFGNGRYARNLIEQALLRQAQRLMEESEGTTITRETLLQLKPEDFEAIENDTKEKKTGIGFACTAL